MNNKSEGMWKEAVVL